MNQKILVENGLLAIPTSDHKLDNSALATILSNIVYYGFALSEAAYAKLTSLDNPEVWWADVEATLKSITGADKKMADHVVYKNFPREVLEMSEAEDWTKQILMYW